MTYTAELRELNEALAQDYPALKLCLRAEQAADLPLSARLYAETRAAEMAMLSDWTAAAKTAFCQQQFEAQHAHYRLHYPRARLLMIEQAGETVGRLYYEQTAQELRLMEVTLTAPRRGGGIGGALTRLLLARAQRQGVAMGLHVEPFNPARRLYERFGFVAVETRGLYLYMRREAQAQL